MQLPVVSVDGHQLRLCFGADGQSVIRQFDINVALSELGIERVGTIVCKVF